MTLTQTNFDRLIQIYTASAVKKGALYIELLKKGEDCKKLFSDAKFMISIIESIRGFDLSITNCISNNDIELMLSKLQSLCACSFSKIINFQIGCLEADQGGSLETDQNIGKLCQDQNA